MTKSAASPSSANGLIVYSGSVAGVDSKGNSSSVCSSRISASARPCGEPHSPAAVRSAANSRFVRQHEVQDRRGDRAEEHEQRALEPAADAAHLDHHRRQDDERRLHCHVPVVNLRQLVGEHALELGGREHGQQPSRNRNGGTARAAPGRERARMRVVQEVEPGLWDPARSASRSTVECTIGACGERQLPRADHPQRDAVRVEREPARGEKRAEQEERRQPVAAERPAERGEHGGEADEQQPRLREIPRGEHGLVGVEVRRFVLGEAARRPVVLRRVATARAVERRDVLKRDQDVPVQLQVRDVLDVAVRGEDAFLVLAAEEGHLDLLTFVLPGVVLHGKPL